MLRFILVPLGMCGRSAVMVVFYAVFEWLSLLLFIVLSSRTLVGRLNSLPNQLRDSELTLEQFRRLLKTSFQAYIRLLTAAAPSDNVFYALGTNWLTYLLTYSHMVGHAGSTTRTVYADVTLTWSKVKVKVTEHLNFRQLPIIAHL